MSTHDNRTNLEAVLASRGLTPEAVEQVQAYMDYLDRQNEAAPLAKVLPFHPRHRP